MCNAPRPSEKCRCNIGGEIQNARPAVSLNWLGDEEISEVPAKWNVKLHQKLCVDILGFTLLSMAGFISRMRL
jgi:hypothetical protein